jgi:predicted RecA/RadA family phage recombinase
MATNIIFEDGDQLDLVCTHPTTPASGDPVRYGAICGVALRAESADGKTTVKFNGVADLSVKAIDGNGNSAVAVGDAITYTDADTPVLSKKAGVPTIGYALEAIDAGATATIRVRLGR